jgi:uncharacterized protein HemX
LEPRREVRSERERDIAFRERQARREPTTHRHEPPPVARFAEPRRPRREGPRRSLILIPFLILISLAAAGAAAYALSKEPSTSRLGSRITTLTTQLTHAQQQIASLESQIATSASARNVRHVNRDLAGLKKSVGGVQNAVVPLRAELNSLRVCLPQLQAEVTGVAAHVHQHGVTTVGLSPECSTFLGG